MKLKADNFYVLLCDCSKYGDKDMMICGVFESREEAKACADEVKDCPAKHLIKKCTVEVNL